jgi:phosphotransferase system enzyme I (PtsI)
VARCIKSFNSSGLLTAWAISSGQADDRLSSFDEMMHQFLEKHRVPGAALAADALARGADFFSIGTNDLTMYTLAIDRGEEQVAHLYNPLHPAVLRLIQFSIEAALRARIPVSVCGEMAGDWRYTALLVGLGVRELSMSTASLPRVKSRILNLDLQEAIRRAGMIMDQYDSGRITALLDDFNALAE